MTLQFWFVTWSNNVLGTFSGGLNVITQGPSKRNVLSIKAMTGFLNVSLVAYNHVTKVDEACQFLLKGPCQPFLRFLFPPTAHFTVK